MKHTNTHTLEQLENIIENARQFAQEEAKALLEIRNRRLWEQTSFKSFEEYVQNRHGYEIAHAYRLCAFAETLATIGEVYPTGELRERTVRPAYGLSKEQQQKVFATLKRKATKPTAKIVEDVVEALLRKELPHPVEQEEESVHGEIVCGDALKLLPTLKDNSIDLLLTSPPYAMQRSKDFPSVPEDKYPEWTLQWMEAARPKMKPSASIFINIREHVRQGQISDYVLRTRLALRNAGWCEIEVLIWHKPDAPPSGRMDRPRRVYENIYWYSTTPTPYTNVLACGEPNKESPSRMNRPRALKLKYDNRQPFCRFGDQNARTTDIIYAPVGSIRGDHPAMYPNELSTQIIKTFSPAGGLVVDPFCGSATTLISAKDNGRNWWGCDLVQDYVNMAGKRLRPTY